MRAIVPLTLAAVMALAGCGKRGPAASSSAAEAGPAEGTSTPPPLSAFLDPAREESRGVEAVAVREADLENVDPAFRRYARMGRENLAGALRLISEELPEENQDKARAALLQLFGSKSLEAIQPLAGSIEDDDLRGRALDSVQSAWRERPKQFFDFVLGNVMLAERNRLLRGAVSSALFGGDFEDAKVMVESMPTSNDRLQAIDDVAQSLGKESLESAVEWAKTLQHSKERDRALSMLGSRIAEKQGLEGLTAILPSMGDSRGAIVAEAARLLVDGEDSAAVEWLSRLPAEEQGLAAAMMIREYPPDRIGWLAAYALGLPDTNGSHESVSGEVIYRLAPYDFEAAAAWTLSLPENLKRWRLDTLVDAGYASDIGKLETWAKSLPAGADRDRVIAQFATKMAIRDKQKALEWAGAIGDEKMRRSVEGTIRK
jgi:hypothetical protein